MKSVWGILVAIWVSGCTMSSDSTSFTSDHEADFSQYRSFAWLPRDSSRIQNFLFDNQIIEESIIQSVNNEFYRMGYVVERDTPDILIQYTIAVEEKEQTISSTQVIPNPYPNAFIPPYPGYAYDGLANPYFYNNPANPYNYNYYVNNYPFYNNYGFPVTYPYYLNNNIYQTEFKEGTLIIDAIDRESGQLVWRGWSKDILYDPESYQRSIPGEIAGIFRKYPSLRLK